MTTHLITVDIGKVVRVVRRNSSEDMLPVLSFKSVADSGIKALQKAIRLLEGELVILQEEEAQRKAELEAASTVVVKEPGSGSGLVLGFGILPDDEYDEEDE